MDFRPNYDESREEPEYLPTRVPNLLVNGAAGIAVGMATNIPPHNLGELAEAIVYLVDHYDQVDDVGVDDLMKFVQGPDFPTGGMIIGAEGILQAYSTGKGRIVVRGIANIEDTGRTRSRIVITEIPFQVNKTSLIERIAELVRDGKLDGISDLRDESDRRGLSIVLELKRTAQPKAVLNQLYKYTQLQTTFGVQQLALINGEPRLLSLKRALLAYLEHRRTVITRRSKFELEKARARAHVLDGLLIALANLDEVIDTIRKSPDADTAMQRLIQHFKLSEIQAQAILDLQLRRLAALERKNIETEAKEIKDRIASLEELLADPKQILGIIKTDMRTVVKDYGDPRRTRIAPDAKEEFSEADLVSDERVLISITARGYVKRVAAGTYKRQGRGGRGVVGHSTRGGEDEVDMLLPAGSLDTVLFFSDKGKVYSEKAYQIPDADRTARGIPMANILALQVGDVITAAVPVPDFGAANFCTMATRRGKIKRVALSEFAAVRPSGLIAMSLKKGDTLGWVRLTSGKDEIILVTTSGKALRYKEKLVRSMGRPAAGVRAISLGKGDAVTSMDVADPKADLLVVTRNGFGKRTPIKEYPAKGRGTKGVLTLSKAKFKVTGPVAAARVVDQQDDLTVISSTGIVLRTKVKQIKQAGRATMGVRVMNLKKGDNVASVARIAAKDLEAAGVKE